MTETAAISVERIWKEYRIGAGGPAYRTLRDSLSGWVRRRVRRLRSSLQPTAEAGVRRAAAKPSNNGAGRGAAGEGERHAADGAVVESVSDEPPLRRGHFWALRDVSFEIPQGQIVGVIGRNGAGKSTLLKVLSRITAPTHGRGVLRGRVASLLEVGTGFHPELTGRENIFLSGSILGMTKTEIVRQFDAIVDFAEVARFVDTPVKHYSSGMYLRLAFAVAAHLEAEVLLVDEVLAVGDGQFQQKCLDKMATLSHDTGRTVLLVSHNMGAILSLCDRVLSFEGGRLTGDGDPQQVVSRYLAGLRLHADQSLAERTDRSGDGQLRLRAVRTYDGYGREIHGLISGEDGAIGLELQARPGVCLDNVFVRVRIMNQFGQRLSTLNNFVLAKPFDGVAGTVEAVCRLSRLPLVEGEYFLDVTLLSRDGHELDNVSNAARLTVHRGDFFGTAYASRDMLLYLEQDWTLRNIDEDDRVVAVAVSAAAGPPASVPASVPAKAPASAAANAAMSAPKNAPVNAPTSAATSAPGNARATSADSPTSKRLLGANCAARGEDAEATENAAGEPKSLVAKSLVASAAQTGRDGTHEIEGAEA